MTEGITYREIGERLFSCVAAVKAAEIAIDVATGGGGLGRIDAACAAGIMAVWAYRQFRHAITGQARRWVTR